MSDPFETFRPSWVRQRALIWGPAVLNSAHEQLPLPALPEDEPAGPQTTAISVAGIGFEATREGGLWWAGEETLIVADLHLEKGSSYAERGTLLPPYDTGATLERLEAVIARLEPKTVIALGDNFHDRGGGGRMPDVYRKKLTAIQIGRNWVWITGNHDPEPQADVGGDWCETLSFGPLHFRHEPKAGRAQGELAGHLHPVTRVQARGRGVRRRCFIGDGRRLVLPAFGALTGGIDARDSVFQQLFPSGAFRAWMIGENRLYTVSFKANR
ncbi:MAG: ligase-associated DNA damage response endonuclease PdeM [Hyphomicrobiales bacterium]|nr:ligase-associated DNA damage response endonuclease PdeM [Hyphomicrobiales bacterium]